LGWAAGVTLLSLGGAKEADMKKVAAIDLASEIGALPMAECKAMMQLAGKLRALLIGLLRTA
jgi:hypothetical protein